MVYRRLGVSTANMAGAEAVRFSWSLSTPVTRLTSSDQAWRWACQRQARYDAGVTRQNPHRHEKIKKLGWHNQLEEGRLKLRKMYYWLTAKALAPGPLLTAGLPCLPQRLPGTDVLRNEIGCKRCGMSRLGCRRYREGCRRAPLQPRAAQCPSALRAKLTSAMRMPSSVAPRKIAVQTGSVPTDSRPPRMQYKTTHKKNQMR
jgi:hypothetical protein